MDISFPVPDLSDDDLPAPPGKSTVHPMNMDKDQDQEKSWSGLTKFYEQNAESIERSRNLDLEKGEKDGDFQIAMDTFVETTKVVLDGLTALANVHPVLGIAIFAFHGVISLDLTRRENDRKVLAVKLQMQSMMCSMFQLRKLRHAHVADDDEKKVQKAHLEGLVKTIANEITQCGSDFNYYSNRKTLSKLIKAKLYQRRFADHIDTFALRRSELQTVIGAYTASGIDVANIVLAGVQRTTNVMDSKIESILDILQRLESPQDREVLTFIDENGGPKNCVSRDDLLLTLLNKTQQSSEIDALRKTLRQEVQEDLNIELKNNLQRFENMLIVRDRDLERMSDQITQVGKTMNQQDVKFDTLMRASISIYEQGRTIKKAVTPTAPIKLKDPELQRIWDQMGLRRSVKAKQFVLTFRDYLITSDQTTSNTPHMSATIALPDDARAADEAAGSALFSTQVPVVLSEPNDSEKWVLKYIDVANIQPIIEAMDEDGSGFISVQEANKFALRRPPGMSLLHWIAYWASGWHYNVTDYRKKIHSIMRQMHRMQSHVAFLNKKLVHIYLDNEFFFRMGSIINTIKPLPGSVVRDPELTKIADSIASAQERRLRDNLKTMGYQVQSAEDVAIIAGSDRLETWLLPLSYLVLERHMELFKLSQNTILNTDELEIHSRALEAIIHSYDERTARLKDIFQQVYKDTEAQFKNYAYGMFVESCNWTGIIKPRQNVPLLNSDGLYFSDEEEEEEEGKDEVLTSDPRSDTASEPAQGATSILLSGSASTLELPEIDPGNPDVSNQQAHPIEGTWVGTYETTAWQFTYPAFRYSIFSVADGKLKASGRYLARECQSEGTFDAEENTIDFQISWNYWTRIRFIGKFDADRIKVEGRWVSKSDSQQLPSPYEVEESDDYICGAFRLTKYTPSAFRFRDLLEESPDQHLSLGITRRRWAFAIEAVRFDVQQSLHSRNHLLARIEERSAWTKLSLEDMFGIGWFSLLSVRSPDQSELYRAILHKLHPSIASVYDATFLYLKDRSWYDVGDFDCDSCQQSIRCLKYTCITCIDEDYHWTLDFCVEDRCSNTLTEFKGRDYVHSFSHTLIRSTQRLLTYEKPTLFTMSQQRSERVKRSFREQEAARIGVNPNVQKAVMRATREAELAGRPSVTTLICCICNANLTLPCWACASCDVDLLFCMDCEKIKRPPIRETKHTRDHYMLRITDSVEANLIRFNTNNKNMGDMEKRINDQINRLQTKVLDGSESKILALEEKITSLESKVEVILQLLQSMASNRAST